MKKERKKNMFLFFILIFTPCGFLFYVYFFSEPDYKASFEILEEKIKPVHKDTFIQDVNLLLDKGYTPEEINQIYEYMSEKNIQKILDNKRVDLSPFYQISNFDFEKMDRYLAYQMLEHISMKDAVTRVNMNLDKPFYTEVETISQPDDVTVLVNKSHALPSDYVPNDLVSIPSFPSLQLRDVAIDCFEQLLAAARLNQVFLIPYSTYRSYDYQDELYHKYLQNDPVNIVDTYSARAGHSEHQTGLAIDIRSSTHWYNLTDADYEWIKKNSYKYGFIIRYPKERSTITGYKEEPWHIRYIGIEHATKVHDLDITYDEYYDIYLTEH